MTIGGGDGGTASIAPVTPEPRTVVPHDAVRAGAEHAGATHDAPSLHPVFATVLVAVVGCILLAASTVGFGLLLTRELLHGLIGEWDVDVTTWFVERRSP